LVVKKPGENWSRNEAKRDKASGLNGGTHLEQSVNRQADDSESLENTFPKLLHCRDSEWGGKRVALRQKEFGIWHEYTWKDCYEKTKFIALGLISLGLRNGDIVSILGYNSPEWLWCELGAEAAGGTVLGFDPATGIEEMKHLMAGVRAKVVFVQDQEQVDKVLDIRSALPSLQRVVYWRRKELQRYKDPVLLSLAGLISMGESYVKSQPGEFERRLSEGKETDVAMILLGQGANGELKAWPATHGFLISSAHAALAMHPVHASDEYVSSASPSWFFEQVLGFGVSLLTGQRLNFAERADTAPMDFREISPQIVMYPSRTWEMMAEGIQKNMEGGSRLKRVLYHWSLSTGRKGADLVNNGHRAGLRGTILNRLVSVLLIRPLRDKHGLNRARVAYAAGGTLSEEASRTFHAFATNVEPVFGSSKDGIVTSPPPREIRIE
jgi:long-chain acyl-CoA synthetase